MSKRYLDDTTTASVKFFPTHQFSLTTLTIWRCKSWHMRTPETQSRRYNPPNNNTMSLNRSIVYFKWSIHCTTIFCCRLILILLWKCRYQWPHSLRCRPSAARLLRSWVRFPPEAWMFVCCECCVLSGRGLCDEMITRPEESYRLWCVVLCDLEILWMRRPWPALGRSATGKKKCNWSTT